MEYLRKFIGLTALTAERTTFCSASLSNDLVAAAAFFVANKMHGVHKPASATTFSFVYFSPVGDLAEPALRSMK